MPEDLRYVPRAWVQATELAETASLGSWWWWGPQPSYPRHCHQVQDGNDLWATFSAVRTITKANGTSTYKQYLPLHPKGWGEHAPHQHPWCLDSDISVSSLYWVQRVPALDILAALGEALLQALLQCSWHYGHHVGTHSVKGVPCGQRSVPCAKWSWWWRWTTSRLMSSSSTAGTVRLKAGLPLGTPLHQQSQHLEGHLKGSCNYRCSQCPNSSPTILGACSYSRWTWWPNSRSVSTSSVLTPSISAHLLGIRTHVRCIWDLPLPGPEGVTAANGLLASTRCMKCWPRRYLEIPLLCSMLGKLWGKSDQVVKSLEL